MTRTAVLLTVFNRKETTLQGMRSLYKAIDTLGDGYIFDIYMTDDGCTDGTAEVISREFPEIYLIMGDGNLYWSGGMRKAWQQAVESNMDYDYYLWFNDDANLYENALQVLFKTMMGCGRKTIVCGAFCDNKGNVSYGGRNRENELISPNGIFQDVYYMNGNFVLIPNTVFLKNGFIDTKYKHGLGDFDYGLRARKAGFDVLLTPSFVGTTERHDVVMPDCFSFKYGFKKRWKLLHNPRNSPSITFFYYWSHFSMRKAIVEYVRMYVFTIAPCLYYKTHKMSV